MFLPSTFHSGSPQRGSTTRLYNHLLQTHTQICHLHGTYQVQQRTPRPTQSRATTSVKHAVEISVGYRHHASKQLSWEIRWLMSSAARSVGPSRSPHASPSGSPNGSPREPNDRRLAPTANPAVMPTTEAVFWWSGGDAQGVNMGVVRVPIRAPIQVPIQASIQAPIQVPIRVLVRSQSHHERSQCRCGMQEHVVHMVGVHTKHGEGTTGAIGASAIGVTEEQGAVRDAFIRDVYCTRICPWTTLCAVGTLCTFRTL